MRRYRNIWHRPVQDIDPGKEGELELTVSEEDEYLAWHRLEILPIEYEIIGPARVNGHDPGTKFEATFTLGQEQHLVDSGHLEIVKPKSTPKADKRG